MLQKRFLLFFLMLCVWVSTAGLPTVTVHAAQPLETLAFAKISPIDQESITTSRVLLSWAASSEPGVQYEYCLFTKANCPNGQWKKAGNATSVTVSVKPNTTYYWQVRARSANGNLSYADGSKSWRFTTVPALPSTFSKSAPASGAVDMPISVKLTWTASTGLNVNYQVCYDTTNNGQCDSNVWLLAGSNTEYTLNGLNYATTYYWQVRAHNPKSTVYADGSPSSFRSFTTRAAPPTPFVKLVPADGAGILPNTGPGMPLNLNLVWSPSTGASLTYQYCLIAAAPIGSCGDSGGVWTPAGANTSVALTGLAYDKTYYWQVRVISSGNTFEAVDANGGTWWSFKTLPTPPTSFEKILPHNNASDVSLMPYLYWSASKGTGIAYAYCLVEAGQPCDNWVDTGAQTFVKVSTPLKNSTTYTWQVRATDVVNNTVTADASSLYTFTTLPDAPVWIVEPLSTEEDVTLTGALRATNPASKTLIYTLAGRAPAGTFMLASNGTFTYAPEPEFSGDVTFTFTIWDGVNEPTAPQTATITVTPVNDPPVILPIADVSVGIGADIFFTVETYDPDLAYGDTLEITLNGALPNSPGASFTTSYNPVTNAASADFEWLGAVWLTSHPGPYEYTLTVTDKAGAVATDPFTVRVEPNTIFMPLLSR